MPILVNIFTLKKILTSISINDIFTPLDFYNFLQLVRLFSFLTFFTSSSIILPFNLLSNTAIFRPKSTINWGQLCTCKLYTGFYKNSFRNQYWKSGSLAVTTRFNLRCYWASSKSQTIKVNLSNGLHWPWLMDGTEIVRWFTCN